MKEFSNLAAIVARRTYSRKDTDKLENWKDIITRAVYGNVQGHDVPEQEIKDLIRLGLERKAIPAGRGLWFSGSPSHKKIGGAALVNCWGVEMSDWENFVLIADLLMLGGGVGASVEWKFVSKLPRIRKDVKITCDNSKDADFIVPDSRQGWCLLIRNVLESYFATGRSFSYSTICVRGYGERIRGFGGTASGPLPLVKFVENVSAVLEPRQGKSLRPIDASDIITAIGEMVVSGNVRRSAILILGDPWDKDYLRAKRWDLGPIPNYRDKANYSVVCDDPEDLHPLYWRTFDHGEAFGIVNRITIRRFGRVGEAKKDSAYLVNPCGEATLEHAEPCNLQELALPNIRDEEEFVHAARLMHRYGKRVTMEKYHHPDIQEVINRNRRIGTGITGCLASPLFNPKTLDRVYAAIQKENREYSRDLKIPESIRTTVIKPSGTVSKVLDMAGYEGIHPAYSRYIIQRVRFASNDTLIPILREAGHYIEPVQKLDGTIDHGTLAVDFYVEAPEGYPVADEDWTMDKQLETVKMAQRHWADQSVSVSVYYRKEDVHRIKEWYEENINEIKTISFLAHSDHGFPQAPKEAINREQFEKLSGKIKKIPIDKISEGCFDVNECEGGQCPVK